MVRERPADTAVNTADGRPLTITSRGWPPMLFNDRGLYAQASWTEIVLWLLNAAAAGVIGNLTHEALKDVIDQARKLHATSAVPRWGSLASLRSSANTDGAEASSLIEPSSELRDKLVKIAHDTMKRYRHISPSKGKNLWSETGVALTKQGTWRVDIREVGSQQRFVVEIDLQRTDQWNEPRADTFGTRPDDPEGFPVRIFYF